MKRLREVLRWLAIGGFSFYAVVDQAATNLSSWVYPGAGTRLIRRPDAQGNRILDYSAVGYQGGGVLIPNAPVKITVSPVNGDDGANIQAAIDQVEALPLDEHGFRGAVFMTAGEYEIAGSISINANGVVLRGAGDDIGGTVLRATGSGQRSLIRIFGSGSASTVSGTTHNITNYYVPVGACSFTVDSTSGLTVGDRVFVRRIATQDWIEEMGMDLLCCPPDVNPWTPSGYHIDMDRLITRIESNRVFINAPITCAIERRFAGGTIRKYVWPGRIQNIGIEDLRGVSDYVAADDEDHGWILVQINSAENVWVRRVTSQYFGYACVALYKGTCYATVSDCRSLDPVSIVTGGRRYAFVMDDNSLCLVQNCYTHDDRHQFVTQSLTTGPNVFVDGLSDNARSDAGPHHRWGTGAIWDNITVNGNALNVRNRGNSGSGHGWAGGNEVVWNCKASSFIVQNPPTARNWLIGSVGTLSTSTSGAVGPAPPGTYDSHGTNVFPNSLYYAELQDRLATPDLQTRQYWFGDIDQFTPAASGGDPVAVDLAWRAEVQSVAGGQPLKGFDLVSNNQWIPFTFNYSLTGNEYILAATLCLSMRAASSAANNDKLFLDSTTNAFSFASLGWLPIGTGTNTTVRTLDLASQLPRLADGRLNVAVQNDMGVDWALLELQVAPVVNANTNVLFPVADAMVRGGTSADSNFGSATTLMVKEDASPEFQRKDYLRWDLSGVTGTVYHATARLTPVSVGVDGLEHGVTLSTSDAWSETGITWENQPEGGKRFATWIPGTNRPVEFVVTPQVQEALAGDRQLSLQLYSLNNLGGAGLAEYASRENPDTNLRPQLILQMSGTVVPVSSLSWNGIFGPNWDVGTSSNWLASGAPSWFQQGDQVRFDDTALGSSVINLTTTLVPGSLTVSNSARAYVFQGPGNLSGSAGLLKQGLGALYLANSGANTLAGGVTIEGGTLRVGNGGKTGNLPPGSVANRGTLVFQRSDAVTVANDISGPGPVVKEGLGDLTFSGANSFTGALTIERGTVRVGGSSALGNSSGATTVQPGATLDVNGIALGDERIIVSGEGVSGEGALVNDGLPQTAAFRDVALAGNTTFGGTGRWDIRNSGGSATLSTGGKGFNITKVGTNQVSIVGTTVDPALGDVDIQEGSFAIQTSTTSLSGGFGDPSGFIIVRSNATLNVWNLTTAPLGKRLTLYEGATVGSESGNSILSGPVSLLGSAIINVRNSGTSPSLTFNNVLSGAGGLIKIGDAPLILSAVNSYGGNTTVSAGTLALTGAGAIPGSAMITVGADAALDMTTRVDGRLNLANNQTLSGGGTVLGALQAGVGSTVSPGPCIGRLTVSGGGTLAGIALMELDKAAGTNDVIAASSLSYGGSLVLTNLNGALAVGDSFKLFSASTYTGSFAKIIPAIPGLGLGWNTNSLTSDGTLQIISRPTPQPRFLTATFSGEELSLSGSNGVPGWKYDVLTSPNVTTPLSDWQVVATNAFAADGNFVWTNALDLRRPGQYYLIRVATDP